jgi:protein-disulfide isomerase/uncharacterized membrane protein
VLENDFKKFDRIVLSFISIIGLIISIESTIVYINANFNPYAAPSFCTIDSVIDCDGVARSSYARFLEIPFSVWGLGFYFLILGILWFPFNKFRIFKEFRHPKGYIFTLATLSLLPTITLWYISSFILEKLCLLCHALYLVNFCLFILSKLGEPMAHLYQNTFNDAKNILKDRRWFLTFVICILIGILIILFINIYKPFASAVTSEIINYTNGQVPFKAFNPEPIGNILGSEKPKLVITQFTDYECPYCANVNYKMIALAQEIKDIRIEHKDFPLNTECNSLIQFTTHKNSCRAVYYARAAKNQGKFWDLSNLLFKNQTDLSEKNILKLAQTLNLDIEKLKKDSKNPEMKKDIHKDILLAKRYGIQGTPSIIIGIRKYEGDMPYEVLKFKVLEAINK